METNHFEKIKAIQEKIGTLTKDQTNPFYNSKFFDINTLLSKLEPILHQQGLIVIQPISKGTVCTQIIDCNTGDLVAESCLELPENNDPQKIGSAITYYRRYTLQSLLALQVDDDDGNAAIPGKPVKKDHMADRPPLSKQSEPETWLNKFTSKNSPVITKEWDNILTAIEKGTVTKIQDVRSVYKVNRELAEELEFLIETKENEAINT